MHKSLLSLAALAATFACSASASTVITQWTFEAQDLAPSTGTGTAALVGGTTATFAAGTGGSGTYGWNTTTYAAQGTGSGTRGVEFMVSTVGFENITLAFDHRASGTASRWAAIEYTTDGGSTWNAFANNNGGLSPHDLFYAFSFDLSSVVGIANNAHAGFRIVSIFAPVAFDQNSTLDPFAAHTAYMRANADAVYSPDSSSATGDYGAAGTWRFDNVTISGSAIPEPSAFAALAGLGALGFAASRRRRHA